MKYIKLTCSFILTLSLSALIITSNIKTNKTVTVSNNTGLILINGVDDYSQDNNIDLSSEENIEVFRGDDKLIYLSEEDIYLMSQIVYAESKGEPFEGKVAVASVILNRVLSPSFPNSIEEVVFQPRAFSCVVDGTITVEPTQDCFDAVHEAINGNDPTGEALFFYNPEIATCSWMHEVDKFNEIPIGQHLFFSL